MSFVEVEFCDASILRSYDESITWSSVYDDDDESMHLMDTAFRS